MNVLVNKNAPFLRGGGDKLKYFVVVSVSVVVVVVVCCGDIDIDIDIIIDRTLLLIINSYIFFVFFFSFCCFFFCGKVCLQNFKENVKKKHACLASIIQNGIH